MKKDSSYKFRLTKQKLWDFKVVCQANRSSMQKELDRLTDEYIEEQKQAGVIIPPCPYPDDPAPEDLTTFKEVISTFGDDLIDAGFTKAVLAKFKSGKAVPTEREYKVISNVSGLAIDHLKNLP